MSGFQAYTCGFMFDVNTQLVLVEKKKPRWQEGLLNGIGGKVEPGENALACMQREWREETGIAHDDWRHVCSLNSSEMRVDFFMTIVYPMPDFPETNDVGERLVTVFADDLPDNIVPNLKWLVPLCMDRSFELGGFMKELCA